jgi:hypothetical protein
MVCFEYRWNESIWGKQDRAQHMAIHPRDVQHSDMVVSQKKVSYVVYSYPWSEASWHRY